MKYVKLIDETGKAVIYLDLEGLKLPIDFDVEPLLKFKIETYAIFRNKSSEFQWNMGFGLVNLFLSELSEQDQIEYATLIITMHYRILQDIGANQEINGPKMISLETELSQMLLNTAAKINMYPRLIDFTEKHIPIQVFAGAGERAQDSEEMTFYRDDVVRLTALVMSSKLMAPIFGVFIESCKKKMDNAFKEMHCAAIMKGYIDHFCKALAEKIINYIGRVIKHILAKTEINQIVNGYTMNIIVQAIFSNLDVRRFVNVDLLKEGGNLLKYLVSCSRAAAQTQFSNGFKINARPLKLPEEDSRSDEGNISNLEAESKSTNNTADYGLLIKAAVHQLQHRFPAEYELDPEMIETMQNFYEFSHCQLTPINSYLLGMVFGNELGGARSIDMLDGVSLNKILPILQLYMFQQGYFDLVHLVTALPTGNIKPIMTGSDTQLRATWNNSYEYKNCEQMYPAMVNTIKWDTGLKTIVDSLTGDIYVYNTAPAMWDKMSDVVRNGDQVVTPDGTSRSICSLIIQTQSELGVAV